MTSGENGAMQWHYSAFFRPAISNISLSLSSSFLRVCRFQKLASPLTQPTLDTGPKLNVPKAFGRCPGRLLNDLLLSV